MGRYAVPSFFALVASLNSARAAYSSNTTVNGVTVAGGLFHTCMIVTDCSLRCFGGGNSDAVEDLAPSGSVEKGFGNYGQIGSGDNETLGDEEGEMGSALAEVDLGTNTVQDVAAGQSHTCVVLTSGDVACFGYNYYGQLGLGDETARGRSPSDMGENLTLVDLGTNRTATRVGCGQHHSCAVLDDGSLKCWGRNNNGMLGLGHTNDRGDSPGEMGDALPAVDLGTGRTAVSVSGGRYHTCAMLDDATLKCWGGGNSSDHNYGQLGQGNTLDIGGSEGQMGDALPAIALGTNRTVLAFATGWYHTCALLDNGSLKCFGRNFDGQLGMGDTEDRGDEAEEMGDDLLAVDLGTDRYAVAITCGRWHTCVLLDNADVKCFGVNTSDDLGAGQLGLEDSENRGKTEDTIGDNLEAVELGTGRTSGWIFAAFDHTCVIFSDAQAKCWGLNASGQLGLGHTDDVGDEEGSMGDSLSAVEPGLRLAFPPSPASVVVEDESVEEESSTSDTTSTSSYELSWRVYFAAGVGVLVLITIFIMMIRCQLRRKRRGDSRGGSSARSTFSPDGDAQRERRPTSVGAATDATKMTPAKNLTSHAPKAFPETQQKFLHDGGETKEKTMGAQDRVSPVPLAGPQRPTSRRTSTGSVSTATGMAAMGAAGVMIIGGVYQGWEVVSRVAETLPWIGAAFYLLNDLVDIVDTKFELEGNLERIRGWAICLRDVILQISRQIETGQSSNIETLKYMSMDVISSLEELVETVTDWEKKGMLAQYVASRSCKRAVDAADTALRGALQRLTVGQATELMAMVSGLQNAGLVVTEKLDMVFEQLRKQEETTARLELRLAEYSEAMAEVLGQYMCGKGHETSPSKTLIELGKETLDRLQIAIEDISYPSRVPFATGTFAEVYQVVHEGTIKAAKKTNLGRLGLRPEDTGRVFGRFVKELYILSRMRSDRVVSVYGAVATPTELTLVMEFVERGSLRSILDDKSQRDQMTNAIKISILTDTAEGMKYLYDAGVEHRDLKSANCLVTHDWRIKISDFGLSSTTDAISTGSTSTMGSFRGGTLVYLAPELLVPDSGVGQEVTAELSDVYSFGVIIWDVVCGNGELPWAGLGTAKLSLKLKRGERLHIPTECSDIYRTLMKNCWAQDPQRRPRFDLIVNTLKKRMQKAEDVLPRPKYSPGATIEEAQRSVKDSNGIRRETLSRSQEGQVENSGSSSGQRRVPPLYSVAVGRPSRWGEDDSGDQP